MRHFAMPFTLSHAILAPPLAKLSRQHLPLAALAIGCMTPDLHRLFSDGNSNLSHQWYAMLYPTLWIGLGFCVLWYGLYRPVIYAFLALKDPIVSQTAYGMIGWIIRVVLAVLVGIASHLLWDGFTHADFRTLWFHEALSQELHFFSMQMPLHRVLQLGSSVLSLPILLLMCRHYVLQHRQQTAIAPTLLRFCITLLLLSISMGILFTWHYLANIPAQLWVENPYYVTGRSINMFARGMLISWSIGCLLFLFLRQKRL